MGQENFNSEPSPSRDYKEIDFDDLIKTRDELRKTNLLTPQEIKEILGRVPSYELNAAWPKLINRALEETGSLDGFLDIEFMIRLIRGQEAGKQRDWFDGLWWEFVTEGPRLEQLKDQKILDKKTTKATFVSQIPAIFIKDSAPDEELMWRSLVCLGAINHLSSIYHEWLHYLQWRWYRKEADVKSFHDQQGIFHALDEVQAYQNEAIMGLNQWSKLDLIRHIQKHCPDITNTDLLSEAMLQMERLRALGQGEKEIALLISEAQWDEKSATIPVFRNKINRLLGQKKMTLVDLDRQVMTDKIKREIEFEKARIIAQEELINLARPNS